MHPVSKHRHVLNLIEAIRDSRPDNDQWFTRGGCWQFHKILRAAFPEAEPWYDGDHVVTRIDGRLYDITGNVSFKCGRGVMGPVGRASAEKAHRWAKPVQATREVLEVK